MIPLRWSVVITPDTDITEEQKRVLFSRLADLTEDLSIHEEVFTSTGVSFIVQGAGDLHIESEYDDVISELVT